MMVRRLLVLASMVLFLWAAPAHADSYGQILDTGKTQTPKALGAPAVRAQTQSAPSRSGGRLAETGQDVAPLIQGGIVLLGAGTLLVLVARRRRVGRHTAA